MIKPASILFGTLLAASALLGTAASATGPFYFEPATVAGEAVASEPVASTPRGTSMYAVADDVTAAKIAAIAARKTFAGTVSSVNDDLVSLNLNGNRYQNFAIDTAGAVITRGGVRVSASALRVGQWITATGTLNGGVITASTVATGVTAAKAPAKKAPVKKVTLKKVTVKRSR